MSTTPPATNLRGIRKDPRTPRKDKPKSHTWRLWLGAASGLLGGISWYLLIRSGFHFFR